MRMTARDWLLLWVLSVLWGGAFFFAAVAVKEVPPLTLVLCRVGIAALILFVFIKFKGEQIPLGWPFLSIFMIMGFFNNLIPFSLLFWAQTAISSGLASILNATTPIFSIVVAHFLLSDEKMAANKVAGAVLGFTGVAVLFGGDALSGVSISTLGILACLGAALSYGFASVFGRRYRTLGITPSIGALGQLSATTIMMIPIVMFFDQPWTLRMPGIEAIGATVSLAVASTALAYLIYFRVLETAGAVNAALVTLLVPLTAIFLGTVFLDEELAVRHYVGMALILIGLIAVDGRLMARLRNKPAH